MVTRLLTEIRTLFKGGSIRGDAAQIYTFQFLALGISLIGGVLIARTLGPSNKGILDLFNLLNVFIVELGFLGFGSGLLYHIANKGKPLNEIHGTGILLSLTLGIITALAGWLGLRYWMTIFPGLDSRYILLAFFLAPFLYYRLSWSNIMTGINQAVSIYRIGLTLAVLYASGVIWLWSLGNLTVPNAIVLTVGLLLLNVIIGCLILYRREPSLNANSALMKESLQYGLIIYLGNIANVMHFKIDQMLINYWLGTKAVGIYAVSVNWAELLFVLDGAITAAALYKISSAAKEESYRLTASLFKVQLVISGISGIILALLAYPLILLLYGEAFRGAVWPLVLLIPGIVAWSVAKIISNFLVYKYGLASYAATFAVLGFAFNILLNYLFLNVLGIGIVGASLASSISYMAVAAMTAAKAVSVKKSVVAERID